MEMRAKTKKWNRKKVKSVRIKNSFLVFGKKKSDCD
jgi:hypothetical protein